MASQFIYRKLPKNLFNKIIKIVEDNDLDWDVWDINFGLTVDFGLTKEGWELIDFIRKTLK